MLDYNVMGLTKALTHKSRLFGNRWLPQTTYAGCSGDLLPPSPPAEKATARQDQARTRPTRLRLPKAKSVLTVEGQHAL
jgi:hypothetical protein